MQSRHRGRLKPFLGIVGSLALLLSVTATTTPSAAPSSIAGVCTLITREEAAKALGAAVPAGTEKQAVDVPIAGGTIKAEYCFYGSEVVFARFRLGNDASAIFNSYRQSLASRDDYQNVKGVGDEAFAAKGQLAVRKGSLGLIVDVGQARGGGAKELNAERSIAVVALGRLPIP